MRCLGRMSDPLRTLSELARTAEDALVTCCSQAEALRTRHLSLVARGFGESNETDAVDGTNDVFDAFDDSQSETLVDRLVEAIATAHVSSGNSPSTRPPVRMEDRLRMSAARCEALLAKGKRGAALAAHLDSLRALWTSDGALAYKSTTEDFLNRVERNRRGLLDTWRDALSDALDAVDGVKSRETSETAEATFEKTENAQQEALAALAVGACHWLETTLERSSAPPVPPQRVSKEIKLAFTEHCDKTHRNVERWVALRKNHTPAHIVLEKHLESLVSIAEFHETLAKELPSVTNDSSENGNESAAPYARAAAGAVGRFLDSALGGTKSKNEKDESHSSAIDVAKTTLSAFGRARIACASYLQSMRCVTNSESSNYSREAIDAAFKVRRDRLYEADIFVMVLARTVLKPASTSLLEGAVAQPWGFHRKPEAMAGTQPCSPHISTWRSCVFRGFKQLEEMLKEGLKDTIEKSEKSSDENSLGVSKALQSFADCVAAKAFGAYARVAPSRAWRDRYTWDVRTIAATLYTLERQIENNWGGLKGNEKQTTAEVAIRALVTRTALLRCPAETMTSMLGDVRAFAVSNETVATNTSPVLLGPDDLEHPDGVSFGDTHAWGRAVAPEETWRLESEGDDDSSNSWGWMPSHAETDGTRQSYAFDPSSDPWPSAKKHKDAFAAVSAAWAGAEVSMVASASVLEKHAALWHRSELNASDVTPLEPDEEQSKAALLVELRT